MSSLQSIWTKISENKLATLNIVLTLVLFGLIYFVYSIAASNTSQTTIQQVSPSSTATTTGTNAGNSATFSPSSFVQSPSSLTLSSNYEVYGDSFSTGGPSSLANSLLWWYGFQQKTGTSYAQGGSGVTKFNGVNPFLGRQVFDNHVSGNDVFFFSGVNDIGQYNINYLDDTIRSYQSSLLYALLPSSCIVACHTTNSKITFSSGNAWTNVGTTNEANNVGIVSATVGSSISCTVTGRYVAISLIAVAGALSSSTSNVSNGTINAQFIDVSIMDGGVNKGTTNFPYLYRNGQQYGHYLALFDTLTEGTSKVVSVTVPTSVNNQNTYINYVAGFDTAQVGCSQAFVLSVPRWNLAVGAWSETTGYEHTRTTFNAAILEMVRQFRFVMKLPVYYVNLLSFPSPGYLLNDGLHPNVYGHKWINERVNEVLNKGERMLFDI